MFLHIRRRATYTRLGCQYAEENTSKRLEVARRNRKEIRVLEHAADASPLSPQLPELNDNYEITISDKIYERMYILRQNIVTNADQLSSNQFQLSTISFRRDIASAKFGEQSLAGKIPLTMALIDTRKRQR